MNLEELTVRSQEALSGCVGPLIQAPEGSRELNTVAFEKVRSQDPLAPAGRRTR